MKLCPTASNFSLNFIQSGRSQHREETAAVKDFYWDEHGRRYTRRGGVGNGIDDRENIADTPKNMVLQYNHGSRKLAMTCMEEGSDFSQPFRDMDASGKTIFYTVQYFLADGRPSLSLSRPWVVSLRCPLPALTFSPAVSEANACPRKPHASKPLPRKCALRQAEEASLSPIA